MDGRGGRGGERGGDGREGKGREGSEGILLRNSFRGLVTPLTECVADFGIYIAFHVI